MEAWRNRALTPVLSGHDDLQNAFQQDGCEQRESERLADYLREVLHEQVQHDDVDKDVNDRCRDARLQPVRGAIVLIKDMINVGGHRVWSTQSVSPSQPT